MLDNGLKLYSMLYHCDPTSYLEVMDLQTECLYLNSVKRLYFLNNCIKQVHTWPEVRYWSEDLSLTIASYKVTLSGI